MARMTSTSDPSVKPSLTELALTSRGAMVMGIGGGAGVAPNPNHPGRRPAEAVLADQLPGDGHFVAGITEGVVGLRDGLLQVIRDRAIDLFVGVDIGSDSFHNGKEALPAKTALVDGSVADD